MKITAINSFSYGLHTLMQHQARLSLLPLQDDDDVNNNIIIGTRADND